MTTRETIKFREWLERQPQTTLTEVYQLLQDEFENRGLNIETDRNFYSNERDSPEQMTRSLVGRFDDVFDKHHGPGGF